MEVLQSLCHCFGLHQKEKYAALSANILWICGLQNQINRMKMTQKVHKTEQLSPQWVQSQRPPLYDKQVFGTYCRGGTWTVFTLGEEAG